MATRIWRIILLSIFALNCAGEITLRVPGIHWGDSGFFVIGTQTPFVYVAQVRAASPAERAGLRNGDRIDMRELPLAQRVAIKMETPPGTHIRIPVQRGTKHSVVSFVTARIPVSPLNRFDLTADVLLLVLAGVLSWRGAATVQGRLLAGLLLSWTFPFDVLAPANATAEVFNKLLLGCLMSAASTLCVLFYFACFGRRTNVRTVVAVLAFAAVALRTVVLVCRYFGVATLWFDAGGWWIDSNSAITWINAATDVLPVLYGAFTLATVKPSEFSRVAWILAAVSVSIWDAVHLALLYLGTGESTLMMVLGSIANVVSASILVYGLLSRRVIDIGFALNRAAVFTGVSVVVVGAFVLIEWAATEWLNEASRTTNAIVGAGIALALGLSARYIHARVDRVIDTVFFRKRHEDEAALRSFARQALYISRSDTLLERTASVLKSHAGAARVEFWLDDGTHLETDADDPALLALRAGERFVFLRDGASALPGDIAYPLIARGRVLGALVFASEESEHSFAPDELDAVESVAHSVGVALDALNEHKESDSLRPLIDELRRLLTGQTELQQQRSTTQ